jgi:hypothetical protein
MIQRARNWQGGVARMATLTASIVVLVALLGLFAPVASAAQPPPPHTGITAIAEPSGRLVGPRDTLLSGERRMLALNYDLTGHGSSVATLRDTPSMPTTTARATSHAYDPARSNCRRQPTDSVVDAPSSKVSAATMNATVGPRAPPVGKFIAAEDGAGAGALDTGGPKPSPNFVDPTNTPQLPPSDLPPGYSVRVMPPTEQYPDGYWVETNESGQPVDPSTGKPPSNVSRAVSRAMTHVPLPPGG